MLLIYLNIKNDSDDLSEPVWVDGSYTDNHQR
jgi:hypothetical protein